MKIAAGSRLGPYEVLAPLGAGGMGEVWRARDTRLGREVAIKVLPAEVASDPSRLKRFEKEARSASALNHPNIVTIHDIGSADSVSYIAMEKVDGKTLRELLFSSPFPVKKLLQVVAQIADGLARAHEAGIVHRDLKPENVMVTKDGLVKILDFGLAKLTRMDSSGEESHLPTETGTSAGAVVGTVGYMSPEQASGSVVDFRSDQFSLGSILYEMATGKRAFQKATAVDTLSAILHEDPKPVGEINSQAPAQLRWIVERCLAKVPEDRYASTRDLARELATVRDHLSEISSAGEGLVASPARRRSALVPILVGAALLLGIVAGVILSRGLPAKGSASSARFQRLTFRRGLIHNARFTPDGQTVLYGATWIGEPERLYATRPGSPESWATDLGGGNWDILAVSPSGELAVLSFPEAVLARVPMAGGIPRQVLQGVPYASADWAPDGKNLAVVREADQRFRLEYPIGKVLVDTTEEILGPRLSPRGDRIAFYSGVEGMATVNLIEISGQGRKKLSRGGSKLMGVPCWTPDGKEVWFTAGKQGEALGIQAVDMTGKIRPVTRVPGDLELDDISKDGRLLVAHHTIVGIVMGRSAGDSRDRDLSWLDESRPADLSSDGKTLLFAEFGQGSVSTRSVYVRKTDGSPAVRLGEGRPLALSRDGARVLALVEPSQALPHLVLLPTGPGETKSFPNARFVKFDWALWLPDNRRFVFSAAERGRPSRLYVQDLQGGGEKPISPEGTALQDAANAVVPDGKSVLALSESGKAFLFPIEGGDPRPVAGLNPGDRAVQWTADGRLLYVVRRESPVRVWLVDPVTGTRKLFREVAPSGETNEVWYYLITPDGGSYVYGYRRELSDLYAVEGLK